MKYTMIAYIPTAVIVAESDPDGRSWVRFPGSREGSEFWVGTANLYESVEACIRGNRQTILDGIKQLSYEVKQKEERIDAMRKLILDY